MKIIKIRDFEVLGDQRGSLISLESNINIDFDIKRVYYIFGTKSGVSRGFHAHRNLKQVIICLSGSCLFILDNGHKREEIVLDSPTKGLLIEGLIWREMHEFSPECILMVLASDVYDEKDYIRDYPTFLSHVNNA